MASDEARCPWLWTEKENDPWTGWSRLKLDNDATLIACLIRCAMLRLTFKRGEREAQGHSAVNVRAYR